MSEESERVSSGPEGNGAGVDPTAVALAPAGASREKADAFLDTPDPIQKNRTGAASMNDSTASPTPPPATQEPPSVEIHKPHAAKTWKEFFIELATITAGIVIALGLEQLVEYIHWQHEVTEGRQALQAEIAANNENLLGFRVAVAPCVDRQIQEAETVVAALEEGQKVAGIRNFRPPVGALIRDSEWQSEQASQVLTHFPRAELALMSRYYGQLPDFRDFEEAESTPWRELSILQAPPAAMTASDVMRLKVSLEGAKFYERLIVINATRQLRLSQRLGIGDSGVDPARVKNYCTMSAPDYQKYRDIQDLR